MQEPSYQYVTEADIPSILSEDKRVSNKLIAGKYNGLQGKIRTESELLIIWSKAKSGGAQLFSISEKLNTMLYLIGGELNLSSYGKVEAESLVVFDHNVGQIEISANSEAEFLLLAGAALNEKVVQQGPYVMNSETEILEAMRDYQMGKMGILIEEK